MLPQPSFGKSMLTRSVAIVAIQLLALGVYYLSIGLVGIDPKLFDLDIGYLFSASWLDLKEFFPNYYWAIYSVCLGIQLGIPIVSSYFLFVNRKWLSSKLAQNWKVSGNQLLQYIFPFFFGLSVSLAIYFSFNLNSTAQLILSRTFIGWAVIDIILLFAHDKNRFQSVLKDFLLKPELPYSLAITRILFFSYSAFLSLGYAYGFYANIGVLDKVALPYIGWLIHVLPVSSNIYLAMCVISSISAIFVAIGYKTRLGLVVNCITIFYVVAVPNFFGKLVHDQLFIWITWILAFSPCSEVLSIDSVLKSKPSVQESGRYGFHLKVIWLHFGVIYFFAGFYKLWICGYDWALSDSMVNQVLIEWFEHFDRIPSIRFDHFPILLKVLGMLAILFELMYVFMLLGKRLRWVSIIGGLIMHNAIGQIMYIAFLHLLQAFYIVFIPWNAILKRFKLVKDRTLANSAINLKSPMFLVPLFILCANILAGILNVSSYPFSVYPTYSEIVPANVKYFEYRVLDKGLESTNVRETGKKVGFQWERYSRAEYHIIRMWKSGAGLDSAGVKTLWRRWQLESAELDEIDSVDVYVVERSLIPENADAQLSEEYLMSIYR